MKVLHIVWSMLAGGVETMLVDIANIQSKHSHLDVGILVVNNRVDAHLVRQLCPDVRVFYCNRKPGSKSILAVLKMNYYLHMFNPDILHFHGRGLVRNFVCRRKKVQTIHNSGYEKNECAYFDKFYAISEAVKAEWLPVVGNKVKTIANGIVCENILTKENFSFNLEDLHFVSVARLLAFQKGQDLLLLAIRKLLDENDSVRIKVHLVGNGPDEALLRKIACILNIEEYVVFEGLKSRQWIYDNLHQFDLFIQPSRFEGFGLTVAEACAAKLPVLVCDREGPLEILDDGNLGMIFKTASRVDNIFEKVCSDNQLQSVLNEVKTRDSESIADLVKKMQTFISGGYPYDKIEAAFIRTREKYDIEQTVNEYVSEYKALLQ